MNFLVLLKESHVHSDFHSEGCSLLKEKGDVTTVVLPGGPGSRGNDPNDENELERFYDLLKEAEAAVIGCWYRPPMLPEHWEKARNLRVFSGTFDNRFSSVRNNIKMRTGTEEISKDIPWVDFKTLESRNIVLVDTSRSMTPSVAEFALALTLNLVRDIPESIHLARSGRWAGQSPSTGIGTLAEQQRHWVRPGFVYGDLTGRRVGLAGFGSINQRYAELLAPFRCSVKSYDPFVTDNLLSEYGVERANSLVELAKSSEIFVVGLPPTPTTKEIISDDVISAMPNGSLFVLVTRMAVVEQEPLWRRIQANEIAAAIDVFAPEPPPADAWFRNHPNVIITPHIAGGTDFCHRRCFTDACKDAIEVLDGRSPRFPVAYRDHLMYQGKLKGSE